MTVTIRNISKKLRYVRYVEPVTTNFRCAFVNQSQIAAGLATTINLSFETDKFDKDYHDKFIIKSENYS
jgi:endonuclease YncB( thermonuclease family)